MEWLISILGEEHKDLLEPIKKEMALHLIPKDKFNEVNVELKAQKEMVAKNDELVKSLTDKAKSADEKEALITKLKADSETFKLDTEKRLLNTQKSSALQLVLSKEVDLAAVDLVANLVNLDNIRFENGKIMNYDEVITPVKAERGTLFKTFDNSTKIPPTGTTQPAGKEVSDADYFAALKLPKLI